ncbi:hypothetical protein EAL2_c11070 [Peptoclostridium acidaminophilum DSM 3953]|uniref:Phage gp6-like head-tail connector protein n=1 Tax=Peptoclostridium acidaminophilum DSM 3953 TaxID=1286171 RepID=W8T689_PEPAC|nr:head-tail connector protein [Peptoclostridium acidaminophilum]AHM56405.1 hypothetical protein EAL2_c11070 [Peptoclostridium acidaminophilum DSM 3953]
MTLEELKNYLRVDGTEEDALLGSIQIAAEKYLENAGIAKDYTNDLYSIAVKLLVTHWYENRNAVVVGSISKNMEFSLSSIMAQLKYCGGDII